MNATSIGPLRRLAAALVTALMSLTAGFAATAADEPPSAVVLMYHRFGEGELPATNIRLDQLEAHIAILKEGGYTVLPLEEVVTALRAGQPLPDRTVAITVDDAYRSFVTEGWPRFKAAGIPVTLFFNTEAVEAGFAGAPTWDDLRRLRDEGLDFGVHMHRHGHMPMMSPDEQEADLETALNLFERELGLRPTLFAYPYGEADAAAMALVARKGFLAAFGQHSGVVYAGEDPWYLPRFALNEQYGTVDRFRLVVDALPIPAADISPTDPTIDRNPPLYGFTVTDDDLPLHTLACYGPDGRAQIERLGQRVEVRLSTPLPVGRARVNCTMPGPKRDDGSRRWRWRGTQFTVLESVAASADAR